MTDSSPTSGAAGTWPLLAYADKLSVCGGDVLQVMVSSASERFEAQLARLGVPGRPGLEERLDSSIEGSHLGRLQPLYAGSYVETAPLATTLGGSYTVQAWVCPTLAGEGAQTIVSQGRVGKAGWSLGIDDDARLMLREWSGGAEAAPVRGEARLSNHSWYFVAVVVDRAHSLVRIASAGVSPWMDGSLSICEVAHAFDHVPAAGEAQAAVRIAACAGEQEVEAVAAFNGKIESPRLFAAALGEEQLRRLLDGEQPQAVAPGAVLGAWDFGAGIDSLTVPDRSPAGAHGRCVNLPTRAVTGHRWRGQTLRAAEDSSLYAAIHFHEDDLADARWSPDLTLPIDPELPSGVYAAKLSNEQAAAYVPFYVRPALGEPTAPVLLIAPTNTYLAYANRFGLDLSERPVPLDVPLRPIDQFLSSHRELGGSLYDTHRDGSGVCYASRLRPIPSIDPSYVDPLLEAPRHFAADLHLIAWLAAEGQAFDVATDEDLHREGAALLAPYDVVMTGSHPEYCSGAMLDAVEGYLEGGGNLMYLGGNGFYWVTSRHRELPHVIEVRKCFSGTRNWQVSPGEEHHSTSGERGGLWRHRGRSAHRLAGVGTTGHAAARAAAYRRLPASYEERVSFAFEGVEGERFGDFGLALGGAAGDEVDASDCSLGTPAHAVVLARSEPLPGYVPMLEDELWYRPNRTGEHNDRIRSELVLFETGRGGSVFSVGSVSWCAALAENDYVNDVSRITANVMRDFLARAATDRARASAEKAGASAERTGANAERTGTSAERGAA